MISTVASSTSPRTIRSRPAASSLSRASWRNFAAARRPILDDLVNLVGRGGFASKRGLADADSAGLKTWVSTGAEGLRCAEVCAAACRRASMSERLGSAAATGGLAKSLTDRLGFRLDSQLGAERPGLVVLHRNTLHTCATLTLPRIAAGTRDGCANIRHGR